jgi:hypothetical protein
LDSDCVNPDNEFDEDDCEGYLTCQDGQCDKVCDTDDPADTTDAAYTFSTTGIWLLSLATILFA